jgi:hypothetical protein
MKTMAQFEFNEANDQLDGGWLGGKGSNSDKKKPYEGESVEGLAKPSGLGFSRKESKVKESGAKKAPILRGGKKYPTIDESNKAEEDDEEEDEELHGVVEEVGLSRTNIMSRDNKRGSDSQSKKSKKNKKKRIEQDRVDGATSPTTSADPTPASAEGDDNGEVTVEGQAKKKAKRGYWGEFTTQPIEVINGEVVKRKRKKTRSKQKNIRKDSRPDEEKPNYRPLTSATLAKKAQRH